MSIGMRKKKNKENQEGGKLFYVLFPGTEHTLGLEHYIGKIHSNK